MISDGTKWLLSQAPNLGATDETMDIFGNILKVFLEEIAAQKGLNGKAFAQGVMSYLHEINFKDGKEVANKDLFKAFQF